jgi:hypothetical protein
MKGGFIAVGTKIQETEPADWTNHHHEAFAKVVRLVSEPPARVPQGRTVTRSRCRRRSRPAESDPGPLAPPLDSIMPLPALQPLLPRPVPPRRRRIHPRPPQPGLPSHPTRIPARTARSHARFRSRPALPPLLPCPVPARGSAATRHRKPSGGGEGGAGSGGETHWHAAAAAGCRCGARRWRVRGCGPGGDGCIAGRGRRRRGAGGGGDMRAAGRCRRRRRECVRARGALRPSPCGTGNASLDRCVPL